MANQQQQVWEQEHITQKSFATMHTLKPSNVIPQFASFLQQNGVAPGKNSHILDIGCGKGRNSMYFASLGYRVTGTDFSEKALSDARTRSAQYSGLIEYELVDLSQEWPYNRNTFDAIIDANSTVFIPTEGRMVAIQEAYRVLKPGGLYFFYGLAQQAVGNPTTPGSGQLGKNTLAPIQGSYAASGFAEKRYTMEELTQAYNVFEIIQAEIVQVQDMSNGQTIVNPMWYAIFRKPVASS